MPSLKRAETELTETQVEEADDLKKPEAKKQKEITTYTSTLPELNKISQIQRSALPEIFKEKVDISPFAAKFVYFNDMAVGERVVVTDIHKTAKGLIAKPYNKGGRWKELNQFLLFAKSESSFAKEWNLFKKNNAPKEKDENLSVLVTRITLAGPGDLYNFRIVFTDEKKDN